MNRFSSHFLIFLIIISFVELSYCCGPHNDPLETEGVHPDWFAAIFSTPKQNSSKIDYEFKCLGAVVNPKVVVVSALCVPMGFQDVTSVRFYNWSHNRNITKHVAYEERSVSEMMNFQQLNPGEVGRNDVNLLILSESIHLNSFVTVKNTGSYIYEHKYREDAGDPTRCIFIDTKGNMHNGYEVQFEYVYSITKPQCCKFFGYTYSEHVPFSPHADKYFIIDDKCKVFLFEMNCFQIYHPDNQSYSHYNPLICPDYEQNPYLYGFLINRTNDHVKVSTFSENNPWINEELKKYP
ncbi:uncharacterized protein [Chelonus insularis]|uniref:uncharacterized protein n=1 Tax=Chelonus insularis TaxID=460826 RepID=UPI0015887ED9|nr:uncharacterized protein LOC118072254 [Chelonus insularis]